MELRTKLNIEPFQEKITYNDGVMFIGSCFASSIGSRMEMGHMPVMINPAGAVFNPVSVCNTIDTIISEKEFTLEDLDYNDGTWFSYYHYTDFSSDNPVKVLEKINNKSKEAFAFLKKAKFLFITLGTARIYRLKKTGVVVSNCHKVPASHFIPELMTVSDIVNTMKRQLDRLNELFPGLKIIFTISPVRHWKDGAHGNQVSKSILFVAVEELLNQSLGIQYFPAYELVMDDLRDYRFYNDDMLHPSDTAINYIWEAFSGCYLESKTVKIYNEVVKITKACKHRLLTDSPSKIKKFASIMLDHISEIEAVIPEIDLSVEKIYFQNLFQ
jgi:hypothetical protein